MCKIIILNVGRGFCSVIITPSKKVIVIDLGSDEKFNPVNDFLLKIVDFLNLEKNSDDKFKISQLILTHPHNDHMSVIKEFSKYFYPYLLTVPCNKEGMSEEEKLNWELIKNSDDELINYLKDEMLPGRTPPLKSIQQWPGPESKEFKESDPNFNFELFFLNPKDCEEKLEKSSYDNNISLINYLSFYDDNILFTGDIMKDGIEYLIKRKPQFRKILEKNTIDFLVAPHHGLRSAFPVVLFGNMKNQKTKRLNIISEKITSEDSNEIVDSRYSSEEFCKGHNCLSNTGEIIRQLRTSKYGHIVITFSENDSPKIESSKEIKEIIGLVKTQ